MNKTKIEWCDYTWNPIKGYCPNDCYYCYAHRMYNRFGWDKTIRFDWYELRELYKIKEPSKIFVGSMIDMYHPDINEPWVGEILTKSRKYPQHTYITLTKFPENLYRFIFPENWWIGVTIDGNCLQNDRDISLIAFTSTVNKRFISFEPMLDASITAIPLKYFDWIIIGGLTPKPVHKKEWIDDILRRADDFNIPVFIKSNANYPIKRQEYPE